VDEAMPRAVVIESVCRALLRSASAAEPNCCPWQRAGLEAAIAKCMYQGRGQWNAQLQPLLPWLRTSGAVDWPPAPAQARQVWMHIALAAREYHVTRGITYMTQPW